MVQQSSLLCVSLGAPFVIGQQQFTAETRLQAEYKDQLDRAAPQVGV